MREYDKIVELVAQCACCLPEDVRKSLEQESGKGGYVLDAILENENLSCSKSTPMCQDTGTPIFYVRAPKGEDLRRLEETIRAAVDEATKSVPLRENAVDPLTSKNTGSNNPVIYFEPSMDEHTHVQLLLKGGGSENLTRLYSLPDRRLDAGRDRLGLIKCVLDAVYEAQGKGCPPYFIGVAVAGLADQALHISKKQLMREVTKPSEDGELAVLEGQLLEKTNQLGIGLGAGEKAKTVLSVKIGKHTRNPPSYFVAVTFNCWALRRGELTL